MPLTINLWYNIIVYKEYEIRLLFKQTVGYLKENHGIKVQSVDIIRYLNIMRPSITLIEVKD